MTIFKGTKGKWECSRQPVSSYGWFIQTTDKSHKNTFIGEVGGGLQTSNEIHANALLISKAPEMLEMLEYLVESKLLYTTKAEKDIIELIKSATTL